ncbi:hypothetical protein K458DRAFT_443670 [Lentithecium fluviatile CBS 122367]|uniref:DUF6594 domain-containing protein n=1 Tax=Lentithecium fluviatile CBS 122367 TaxID=1168545 RepID=A0A6G1IY22_9PLEO|nr:hypothetical protein K458DRAFT_443670 [Lentithecium fluviatile CBS 122367]
MGSNPETAIFRRFNELNTRLLLCMQAELCRLEKELLGLEMMDKLGEGDKPKYSIDYEYLALSYKDANTTQFDLVKQIKEKLKEYSNALIQTSLLFQLEALTNFDLHDLQNWLSNDQGGSNCLRGVDSRSWGTANNRDCTSGDLNAVKLFKYDIAQWFKCQCFGRQKKDGKPFIYYDTTMLKITFWMTSIVASLIPIASIAILLTLEWIRARVGTIAGFNILISVCLTLFTDAKRTDCFAVTAAFTAIQVVFLGVENKSSI